MDINEVAFKQAEKDFFEAHKQITALEDQAMKYLTGENSLDIGIVNGMKPKYQEKMYAAQERMEEARARMEKRRKRVPQRSRKSPTCGLGQTHSTMLTSRRST